MKNFFLIALFLVCWVATADIQAAENGPAAIVTAEELKALLDAGGSGCVLVDARTPEEYQEVHIRGAISIPVNNFEESRNLLPEDKTARLIFYCNGVKCGKSGLAAQKAAEAGYTNVAVFAAGMPVWEEKGYPISAGENYQKPLETAKLSPTELHDLLAANGNGITVVDVRDPQEFQAGHIPGAINIPLEVFATQSGILDKGKRIVVYCNSGSRSYAAYRKLMQLSYKNIFQSLFFDWKQQGLPVETGSGGKS